MFRNMSQARWASVKMILSFVVATECRLGHKGSYCFVASGQGCTLTLHIWINAGDFLHVLSFSCGLGRQKSLLEVTLLKNYPPTPPSLQVFGITSRVRIGLASP